MVMSRDPYPTAEAKFAGGVDADVDVLPAPVEKGATAVEDEWQEWFFYGALDAFTRR